MGAHTRCWHLFLGADHTRHDVSSADMSSSQVCSECKHKRKVCLPVKPNAKPLANIAPNHCTCSKAGTNRTDM